MNWWSDVVCSLHIHIAYIRSFTTYTHYYYYYYLLWKLNIMLRIESTTNWILLKNETSNKKNRESKIEKSWDRASFHNRMINNMISLFDRLLWVHTYVLDITTSCTACFIIHAIYYFHTFNYKFNVLGHWIDASKIL